MVLKTLTLRTMTVLIFCEEKLKINFFLILESHIQTIGTIF